MSISDGNSLEVGDPTSTRGANRLTVLETLHRFPASSRAELTRLTGLSRPTVSALLEDLVEAHVVCEASAAEGAQDGDRVRSPRPTGRPPTRLSLARRAGHVLGIDLAHRHVAVAVCNLAGEVLAEQTASAAVDDAPAATLDLAAQLAAGALSASEAEPARLVGVGIAIAAPLDPRRPQLHAGGILPGWNGVDPAIEMGDRLGVRVAVGNDANLGALAERAFGAGRDVDNLVYIRLSAGLGAGLILGGRPYVGAAGIAGELGHVLSDPRGPICRCGNRGCLEAVAGPVAVAQMLEATLGREVSVIELMELVAAGDRGACRAVAEAGEAIGRASAGVVNLLNPELLLVGGELAQAGEVLLEPLGAELERHTIPAAGDAVRVGVGTLGARAEVLGAAALALSDAPRVLAARLDA
jgi:predicted NBD/HSP70 family sugar kinase